MSRTRRKKKKKSVLHNVQIEENNQETKEKDVTPEIAATGEKEVGSDGAPAEEAARSDETESAAEQEIPEQAEPVAEELTREEKEESVSEGPDIPEVIDETPVPVWSDEGKRRFPWKKAGIITGASIAGIAVVVYISGMIYLKDKFFMNTTINGFDVSYCTVPEVEATIAGDIGTYSLVLQERGGDKETIKADQIDYRYVSNGEVQAFLEQQQLFNWPAAVFGVSQFAFESSTAFDEDKLDDRIDELKCFDKKVEQAPADAYMAFNGKTYEMAVEKQGKKVEKRQLRKVLREVITEGETTVSLEDTDCYAKPKVTSDDKDLQNLIRDMNEYAEVKITYQFGEEQEVLDGSTIHKWLSYDEEGNVTIDDEKIRLYVDYLADRYDTYKRPRHYQTQDGSYVTVEGGSYGWLIDREAEAVELKHLIYNGINANGRDPMYAQTAVSRANSDLGNDYIEIDLTKQHLWMYIDGEPFIDSDFVSGTYNVSRRRTPPGTFTLYYKKSPSVLRSNYPGDSYETPVTYWMPFNGGVGLHDAYWRGSFGGEIYRNSGSHGCINLPSNVAKAIYGEIYAGMPIICFYR